MTDVLFYMRMNVHMYIYQPHSSHVIFVGVKWKVKVLSCLRRWVRVCLRGVCQTITSLISSNEYYIHKYIYVCTSEWLGLSEAFRIRMEEEE